MVPRFGVGLRPLVKHVSRFLKGLSPKLSQAPKPCTKTGHGKVALWRASSSLHGVSSGTGRRIAADSCVHCRDDKKASLPNMSSLTMDAKLAVGTGPLLAQHMQRDGTVFVLGQERLESVVGHVG